jgi:subtilisin family serine protease
MVTPHVAAVAALMLPHNPVLNQAQVESILKLTALPVPSNGSQLIYDGSSWVPVSWDTDCAEGGTCDPVGASLLFALIKY